MTHPIPLGRGSTPPPQPGEVQARPRHSFTARPENVAGVPVSAHEGAIRRQSDTGLLGTATPAGAVLAGTSPRNPLSAPNRAGETPNMVEANDIAI